MEVTLLQLLTFSIAVLGAVLGIINTWHNIDKTRVKLKVSPARAVHGPGPYRHLTLSIEVTNLSAFAVTIYEAGVFYSGSDTRAVIPNPILTDGGKWPRRLEPRSSVSILSEKPANTRERKIKCAFAKTQCGSLIKGNSKALKQMGNEYDA